MKRIPLFTSQLTDKDIAEGERVLRRNYQLTKGEEVVEFERALAEKLHRFYCVVVNSGCSALEIALTILRDKIKQPIPISPFTYHGVFYVFNRLNIKYQLSDIEWETYSIVPHDEWGENYVLTHIGGFASRYSSDCILEDACQGFGAYHTARPAGSFGRISILSFCQNKIITTGGEGGALLMDSALYYGMAKKLREYNYRMSSHQAAIGLSQLSRINEIIKERRRQAHILNTVYPCALDDPSTYLSSEFQCFCNGSHTPTYQMYLVKPEVEVPDYVETKMRFDGCELLKEIPLALSQVVAAQSEAR
jgi:perosamine synthetase